MDEVKCKTCAYFAGRPGKCTVDVPEWAEPFNRPTIYSEDGVGCPCYEHMHAPNDSDRISALEREKARLREAITDIRGHCKNDGLPNEIVLDRVIERVEEVADAALGGNHD